MRRNNVVHSMPEIPSARANLVRCGQGPANLAAVGRTAPARLPVAMPQPFEIVEKRTGTRLAKQAPDARARRRADVATNGGCDGSFRCHDDSGGRSACA